jgi:hypothetical protein
VLQHRWQTFLGSALAALTLGGAMLGAQTEFSSANRQRGRAAVEYRDKDIHIVAAYYYSQRNHESRWLMIETGVSTNEPTAIARDAIALRTPEGREIPLAGQRQVGEDVNRITALLQNASAVNHDVVSYFTQRDRVENMNLFTLPFGEVVHDDFVVDRHRVAVGRLFFAAPTGAWESGTYALVVRHSKGTAELPIALD